MDLTATTLRDALADRYRVDAEIGRGGMATVFRAHDLRHDRPVALKVLHPELGAMLGVERFLAEIRVTANLQHPNLLPLYDSGDAGGLLFYVMPFVEGESLRVRLTRERQLGVDDAVRLTCAVLDGLSVAHAQGVVHRDLKPENILLLHGQPVIADFGIALAVSKAGGKRMTQTGLSLGTPQYMSPEQASGDRALDARSDLYSVGAILYEMLAGEPPHAGGTMQAILAQVLTEKPRDVRLLRDTVPAHVAAAIDRALAKVPADRFESAAEFARALRDPNSGPVVPITRTVHRAGRRWGWPTATLVALLAAAAAWVLPSSRAADAIGYQVRRQLTFEGTVLDAALTRDGAWLAYVTGACARAGCSAELLLREVDGTQSIRLLRWPRIAAPKWSPDGTTILFLGTAPDGSTGVFVTSRLGGTPRRLADSARAAAFAPDGRALYVVATTGRTQRLQRFDASTFALVDEAPLPEGLSVDDIMVDPGGKRLAGTFTTVDNAGLILLDARGALLDTVNAPARAVMRWTPDGSGLLAMILGPGIADDLVRFEVRGDRLARDTPRVVVGQVSSAYRGGFDVGDRRMIAVISQTRHELPFKKLDLPGAAWERLPPRSGFLHPTDFSMDGDRLLASATDNRGDNIYEFDLATGEAKAIVSIDGTREYVTWSPSGTRVVYQKFDGPRRRIVLANARGGAERVVATVTGRGYWLSDTSLLYAEPTAVVAIDTLGRQLARFRVPDSLVDGGIPDLALAVDVPRARVAFASARAGGMVVLSMQNGAVTVLRPSSTPMYPVGFATDGDLLYVEQANVAGLGEPRLMRLRAGAAAVRVSDIPAECGQVVVGAGGRRATCRVDHTVRDVWLLEREGRP